MRGLLTSETIDRLLARWRLAEPVARRRSTFVLHEILGPSRQGANPRFQRWLVTAPEGVVPIFLWSVKLILFNNLCRRPRVDGELYSRLRRITASEVRLRTIT